MSKPVTEYIKDLHVELRHVKQELDGQERVTEMLENVIEDLQAENDALRKEEPNALLLRACWKRFRAAGKIQAAWRRARFDRAQRQTAMICAATADELKLRTVQLLGLRRRLKSFQSECDALRSQNAALLKEVHGGGFVWVDEVGPKKSDWSEA